MNDNQQEKKDRSLLLGNYLESRNKSRGRQLQEIMPVDMDNHLAVILIVR